MDRLRKDAFVADTDVADDGNLVVWISRETVDRTGEILIAAGCKLDNYRRNPVLIWDHDTSIPPIGRVVQIEAVAGEGVRAEIEFADSPFGREIENLYRSGCLNAFSHWFRPITWSDEPVAEGQTGTTFLEWEILECSAVGVPANADALAQRSAELDQLALAMRKALQIDGSGAEGGEAEAESSAADEAEAAPDGPPCEDDRIAEDLARLCGAAEALRNITRHDRKAGDEQRVTAEAVAPALESLNEIIGDEPEHEIPDADTEPEPSDAPEDTLQEQAEPDPPDGALSEDTLRTLNGNLDRLTELLGKLPEVHAARTRNAVRDERRRHIGGR